MKLIAPPTYIGWSVMLNGNDVIILSNVNPKQSPSYVPLNPNAQNDPIDNVVPHANNTTARSGQTGEIESKKLSTAGNTAAECWHA